MLDGRGVRLVRGSIKMAGARRILAGVIRTYTYMALLMFGSGVIAGGWLVLAGHDLNSLVALLR